MEGYLMYSSLFTQGQYSHTSLTHINVKLKLTLNDFKLFSSEVGISVMYSSLTSAETTPDYS